MTATNVYLKAKIDERTSQAAVLANLQAAAAEAQRDLTEPERTTFDGIVARLGFLDQEIERIVKAEEGAAKFVQVYGQHASAVAASDAARRDAARNGHGTEERTIKTWGAAFTDSPQFTEYQHTAHGNSAAFTITGDWLGGGNYVEERTTPEGLEFAPVFGLDFSTGRDVGVTTPGGWGEYQPRMPWSGPTPPAERFPLMQVIGRVPTTMGSVEYYYWFPGTDKMAGEVPEGQTKPEAELGGELMAMPIATYAWWKGITRQALDDIPQIRAVVDGFLRRGVIRKINAEAVLALNADTNIPGTGRPATDSLLALIRLARAQVEIAGYGANAVILNPTDWAAFDVNLSVREGTTDMASVFWGLTPVGLPGIPTGTAYVGDFRETMTFFDRQQTSVFLTDSHADYFLRNKMVILAEARGKVAVTNAASAVKCVGAVPPLTLPQAPAAADHGHAQIATNHPHGPVEGAADEGGGTGRAKRG